MNNRSLYFGSARGIDSSFPYGDLREHEAVEAYAHIVESSLKPFPSGIQFALIELIEFQESGDRRSSSIVYSSLSEDAGREIMRQHYDVIRTLKREPGMDWSTLSANIVHFGPTVFCMRKPHDASVQAEQGEPRWSEPSSVILPGDYRITDEPDEASVLAKLDAYAKRVAAILPTGAGVLHVLVVPFSMLDAEGQGKKLGAACILVDAVDSIADDVIEALYTKAQLFWLRFCSSRAWLADGTGARLTKQRAVAARIPNDSGVWAFDLMTKRGAFIT